MNTGWVKDKYRPGSSPNAKIHSLVKEALDGSDKAFEDLVVQYRRLVTSVARRFFPVQADAEDIAQETFVKAYINLDKLKPEVPFINWLTRITINICLDRLRREKRRPEQVVSQISEDEVQWIDRYLENTSREKMDFLENRQTAQALLARILPLIPAKDQLALRLLYGEGFNVSEVAELLDWSVVNVRVRAYRAKRSMRKALETILSVQKERPS